jgi:hypothetical protein
MILEYGHKWLLSSQTQAGLRFACGGAVVRVRRGDYLFLLGTAL